MDKTKIEWCNSTWNPVTGCLHGCEYCYARRITNRFGKELPDRSGYSENGLHCLDSRIDDNPYPYLFEPTLHGYRLGDPANWTKPRTIFVGSMADLFGVWVPDEWIEEVFKTCETAPQHRYLFLTKNPNRYIELSKKGLLPQSDNMWFGYSATKQKELWEFNHADECPVINLFVSIEPMLEPIKAAFSTHCPADWVIIGAETGNRKNKVIPKREWIEQITMECEYSGIPIFMKNSLIPIVGKENMRREFPW